MFIITTAEGKEYPDKHTKSNEKEKEFSKETVYMWMILYNFFMSNGFYETKQK